MKRAMALGALLVAMAACGGEGDGPESAPEPAAATTPTPDSERACAMVFEGGAESVYARIPDAITSVGAQATGEQIDEIRSIQATLDDASDSAEAELAAAITSLNVPFTQFMEVVNQGGGDVSMSTSNVMSDAIRVADLCADAGYNIPS